MQMAISVIVMIFEASGGILIEAKIERRLLRYQTALTIDDKGLAG